MPILLSADEKIFVVSYAVPFMGANETHREVEVTARSRRHAMAKVSDEKRREYAIVLSAREK